MFCVCVCFIQKYLFYWDLVKCGLTVKKGSKLVHFACKTMNAKLVKSLFINREMKGKLRQRYFCAM